MSVISLSTLVDALRLHRLLEPAQLDTLPALQARHAEPKALAGELIRRDWLTPFQANMLLQGRGAELVRGSYLLLERLGEGGMGEVFKARHRNLRRVAAIKLIRKERLQSPDAVRRFVREVRAAAALAHPNIVRAYDADEIAGTHLLAMEYIDGAVDLARLIKERGPLPVAQACACVRQAALGLQHAFERGMVHRDIKPHNLLLTRDGATIKVLDMGLARLDEGHDETSSIVTREGSVMGTPDYIAPEQAMDSHTVDIRADIYSLGCTLYFLLTGQTPFPGGNMMEKLLKHRLEEPTPLERLRSDVPGAVAQVVRRMMAKKPADRYPSPADVAAALEDAVAVPSQSGATFAGSDTAIVADASADAVSGEHGIIVRPTNARLEAPWPRWLMPAVASGVVLVIAVLALLSYVLRAPAPKPGPGADDIVVTLPPRPRPSGPSVEPNPEPAKPAVGLSGLPPELLLGDAWGRFPPGSWAKRRTKTTVQGFSRASHLKLMLKSVADGVIVLEQQVTELKKPVVLTLAGDTIVDLYAPMAKWKEWKGSIKQLGEEVLTIAGRQVRTQVIEIGIQPGGDRSRVQVWIARDIPGAVCRSVYEVGGIRSEGELVEFEIAGRETTASSGHLARAAARTLRPHVGYMLVRVQAARQVASIPRDQPLPSEPFSLIGVGFDKEELPADFGARTLIPAVGGLAHFAEIHDPHHCLTLSADDLARLAAAPTAPALTTLNTGIKLSGASLDALKQFPNLVSLRCSAAEVDDTLLGRLKELPKVKHLGLRRLGASGKVTLGKGLMALAKQQLQAVSFRESTLRPIELIAFVAGAGVASLERADLADVPVQDGHLTILSIAKRLTDIGLDRTRISDAGLVHLGKLKTLRAISLVGTKVSEAGVQKLSAALPECRITWDRGVVQPPAKAHAK